MNLYYLTATDDNGDDYSLHIRTTNMHKALAMWLSHWFDENPESAMFNGFIVPGAPASKADEKLLIYEDLSDPDVEGVVEWGRDIIIVGHVNAT